MVVRRIREHVASHNWFAVGIDFAIVIAGVFLGIQVANWNDALTHAERGREYRARLIRELDFNRQQYQVQLAYYQKARNHGLAALGALREPNKRRSPDFLIDAYQATQLDEWPAKRFIYDEMVSAGMVASLGDFRVQELASDFYLGIDGVERALFQPTPYRDAARGAIPYAIQQDIRTRCGDRIVESEGRVIGIALPDSCRIQISPALAAEGMSRIGAQPQFESELTRHIAVLDQKVDILGLAVSQAEDALAALRGSAEAASRKGQ